MSEVILWFLACLLSTSGITYMFLKFTDSQLKISIKLFIIFIIGWIAISLFMAYDILNFRLVFFFVFYPIFFYFIKHMSIKKIFYYVIIIWFYGVIVDFIIMFLLALINYFGGVNIYNELFGIIPTMISSVIFFLFGNIEWIKKFTNKIMGFLLKIRYSDFLLTGFTIFTFSIGVAIIINIHNLNLEFLLMVICLLIIITFILMVNKKITENENIIFLSFLNDNNNYYIKMDEENNVLKHNLIAKLLSIKSVSNQRARLLIDEMIREFTVNADFLNHIKEIPYGLNGVIYEKISFYAENLNIKISNDIKIDIFSVLTPKRYNVLVEKFSLLLDNAIESCIKSASKILIINLYEDKEGIYIDIKNTFNNIVDLDNLGTKNYTTKGRGHGLGIFSVLRNNEVSVKFQIIDNIFVSNLYAKKNES